jgi:hypothetical protein
LKSSITPSIFRGLREKEGLISFFLKCMPASSGPTETLPAQKSPFREFSILSTIDYLSIIEFRLVTVHGVSAMAKCSVP